MKYYEVALVDRGLKRHQTLTYSMEDDLPSGTLVRVPIRNSLKNGLVMSEVSKPEYQTKPLTEVLPGDPLPSHLIELIKWLADYYAVDLGACAGLIVPTGANKKRRDTAETPLAVKPAQLDHALTDDQTRALKAISKNPNQTYMLHGVTGSGKTRVYIELAKQAREAGNGSVILVPEIGLTAQMATQFQQFIEDEIFIVHSNQTEATRHKQWLDIQGARAPIVIGPRSALFSPIKNLGLVVVDEEHETSYKQDVSPKYYAPRVAAKLRSLTNSTLILGSATPNIEDYHLAARAGEDRIIRMAKTVKPKHKISTQLVDLKDRESFKRDNWLSEPLLDAITSAIEHKKQTILFHNRRGTSTSVVCKDCGWVAGCPDCELPLTHHGDWGILVCHICNFRSKIVSSCPKCGSAELAYKGAGTKEIVSRTRKLFPLAKVVRFDSDITEKTEKLEQQYQNLVDGEADIIIGTQMIAKGLDLPKLAVVGVILADTALYLPDYSSAERTYQLITQVIGRSGRHQDGQVVIQSYNPNNASIRLAMEKNWDEFYELELKNRRVTGFPPYRFMLKLTYEHKDEATAQRQMHDFAHMLEQKIKNIKAMGPSPAFHFKTRTGWRWQLVITSEDRGKLVHIANHLPPNWQHELDPLNLL